MPCDIPALLTYAHQEGASDLHLSTGQPPILRVRGSMVRLQGAPLTKEEMAKALRDLLTDDQRKFYDQNLELDFGFTVPGVSRVRANIFVQERGESGVFRLVPSKIRTLEELGMPPIIKDLAMREKGLVVVTGPTGSGKSTTLAAIVDYVNGMKNAHIITIEDPIEYMHESKKCLVSQREVGAHTHSFAAALRSGLREDPDIILVGELRDLVTTQLAISAAETGHLVLATLHTNSAAKTVDRIIDIFPGDQQQQIRSMLAESLEGVIAQTLLVSKDGLSRVAAVEVLIGIPALRNLIREDKSAQIPTVMQTSVQYGMQSLDQSLLSLVKAGHISRNDAKARALNPSLFDVSSPDGAPTSTPNGGRRPGETPVPERPSRPGLGSR